MNKNIRALEACKYLICAILLTGLMSCDKRGFSYNNIVDVGPTSFLLTDTLTMNVSTAYLDSVATSNTGTGLVGTNTDTVFGKISASAYWQVRAYSGSPALPLNPSYDSMVLMMHPKTYAYGDTTKFQQLEVYRVTEKIQGYYNAPSLYSYNSFATESTPLGATSRRLSPIRDSVFSIRLNDNLGQQFFTLISQKSLTMTRQDLFEQMFHGLAIKPGAASEVITPFRTDDSLNMRLFYHYQNGGLRTQAFIDFPLTNPAVQFNHIDVQRPAGSPLATLNASNSVLPTSQTKHQVYIQPLTNLIARIDMPGLRSFGQLHKFFKIMRATLTVTPVRATYHYPYPLPPALTLTQISPYNDNTVLPQDSVLSPATGAVQHGNLVLDLPYNTATAYTYDITNYVIAMMNSSDQTFRCLALMPPGQTGKTNFTHAILGDKQHPTNSMSVQVYYVVYH